MKKQLAVSAAVLATVLSGCATQSSNNFQAFQAEDLNALVKSGKLVQKTDSFVVLNDSSSSMGKTYLASMDYSGSKLDVEKNLLNKFNKTIPTIPLSSGLRSFGFGPCVNWGTTHLNQPVQSYTQAGFESAITSLQCASGGTPLADALTATTPDIASSSGKNIALIVFSDGMDETSPVPAAEALKAQYGDKLCIYSVWVGNEEDTRGQSELQNISDISGCGFTTTADAVSNPAGMSEFVKRVFFKPGSPAAPDCSKQDADSDGVNNCLDKCPDTPKGAVVDKEGCWAFHGVLFDFDSDQVKSKYEPLIQNAVHVMKLNPGLTVEIQGHTDNYGTDAYNQDLSERRANSVKNELIKLGVNGKRLGTAGFGESQPVDTNETDEGRAYNRRVVYKRTDK